MKNAIVLFSIIFTCFQQSSAQQKNLLDLKAKNTTSNSTGCVPGTAESDLDINNVRATIRQNGATWSKTNGNAGYEVPKGSGKHCIFAGGLWISATDSVGNLVQSEQTYLQSGNDFWPGPIDPITHDITPATSGAFDKIWKINRADVINFLNGGSPTADMITYPGNSPYGGKLAPFYDVNGDGIYNVNDGDYPDFDLTGNYVNGYNSYLHGDQCLWWVFNDVGNVHSSSGCNAMGVEVQAQAYGYNSTGSALDNTTFYQYSLINRSTNTWNNTSFSQWADIDLGYLGDDYIGCDVGRNMGYGYNGDAFDDGLLGYGWFPPTIGIKLLQGPLATPNDGIDNNHNGLTDEPGEEILMSKFMTYENANNSPNGNPTNCNDFRHYSQGVWQDLQVLTYGGNGRDAANPPANFFYPSLTDPAYPTTQWTEITAGNTPGDRRFLMSANNFTMLSGTVQHFTAAIIWEKDSIHSGIFPISTLGLIADSIQAFFNTNVSVNSILEIPVTKSMPAPNPFNDVTVITINDKKFRAVEIVVFDLYGRLVRQSKCLKSDKIIVQKNELKSGTYFYKISDEHGKQVAGKLVVY